jgi:hypothetical protein
MALQSALFRNDEKIEAAAKIDSAHIVPNSVGPHVSKIQTALMLTDNARIEPDEIQKMTYGKTTAEAVLAFKRKRDIVNRSYQTTADNIVGKLTVAALDKELVLINPLSTRARIKPAYTAERLSPTAGSQMALQLTSSRTIDFQGGPAIVPPNLPRLPLFFQLSIPTGGSTNFEVIKGVGAEVDTSDRKIGMVFDPGVPNAHGGRLPVTRDPHLFRIDAGNSPGKAILFVTSKTRRSLLSFDDSVFVNVHRRLPRRKVSVRFHFLKEPATLATIRKKDELGPAMADVNDIFNNQAMVEFNQPSSNDDMTLAVPQLRGDTIILDKGEASADWIALRSKRSLTANVNVFFVKKLRNFAEPFPTTIAVTGPTDHDCVVVQDELRTTKLGIVLAHEFGHILREPDDDRPEFLMNHLAPGRTIPDGTASRMNKSAADLK